MTENVTSFLRLDSPQRHRQTPSDGRHNDGRGELRDSLRSIGAMATKQEGASVGTVETC